jgi:sarcosine oxidase / L-pipecolate oxidase
MLTALLNAGILFPPQKYGIINVTTNSMMTNYGPSHPKISLPRYGSDHPQDVVPKHKQDAIRQWMKDFLPELAEREWSETRLCWSVAPFLYNDNAL